MLEESLFVSIANIRKKTFSDSKSYPEQYDPPILNYSLNHCKRPGDGVDPVDIWLTLEIVPNTTILCYSNRRSARFGFRSTGGTGGTTSRCQLVEPHAQQ